MAKKSKKTQEVGRELLPEFSDAQLADRARMAMSLALPVLSSIVTAYIALRKRVLGKSRRPEPRNCDVMSTAAALRKGWERHCEYGEPCCPFEYAMAPCYGKDGNK